MRGAGQPAVTTAVVAVCSGDGLAELFANLRVQGIVAGGQTLNPSTAELLDTVEHVNADQVVILPNNKNIIPVAEQVDALTSKTVIVVPTRTMPEALAALIVYDPEADAAVNADEMNEAIESIATGEVTQAVRDSNSDAGPIAVGDWMGIVRGDGIVAVADGVAVGVDGAARSTVRRRRRTPDDHHRIRCRSRRHRRHRGVGRPRRTPTCRSRYTAAASRCTPTSSASSDGTRGRLVSHTRRPVASSGRFGVVGCLTPNDRRSLARPRGDRCRAAEGGR